MITVDPLVNATDYSDPLTSPGVVAAGQSKISAEQFSNATYQDIASGTKVAIEDVDVSLSDSFVVSEDSNDEVNSDQKSTSDSSTDSDETVESTSSDGTSSESTDEASSNSPQVEAQILASDEVLTNFSADINSKKAKLMGVFGIMKPLSRNVTAPLIQRTLIDQRVRVRNAP